MKSPARSGEKSTARSGQQDPARSGQQDPARSGQQDPARAGQQDPTRSGQQDPARSGQDDPARSGLKGLARQGKPRAHCLRTLLFAPPAALALLAAGFGFPGPGLGHPRLETSPYRDRVAVASESGIATRIGLAALRSGANAVDAAIAMVFALGVVQPESSGIGGGGFALVWDAAQRKVTALDFRETAPSVIDVAGIDDRPKKPKAENRGRMIGVPGEVAGIAELHRRFGKRSLADDAAPAIALAEDGFYTNRHLAQLAVAYHAELEWSSELSAIYKPGGWAAGTGRRIANPELGATLRRIGNEGASAFYEGKVASEIARAAQAAGGTLTVRDLRGYRVIEREPLKVRWEDRTVYTMPPPSAGGLLLAETLGMFSQRDLEHLGFGTGAYIHLLAETFRGALADRMRWVGDPAFVGNNVAELTDASRLLARRGRMALDSSRPVPKFPLEEHGTTHLIVVDEQGNIVSLTTTVNGGFGAFVSTETTGVLLNDELSDFTPRSVDVLFNPHDDGPNRPRPLARPTSSMTPTIAFRNGQPDLVLGGSGGLRIGTGVTQAFLAQTVFGLSPDRCVALARFHTPTDAATDGAVLEVEEPISDQLVQDLRKRGEAVHTEPNYSGVQMVAFLRRPDGGLRMAPAADHRKGGLAVAE